MQKNELEGLGRGVRLMTLAVSCLVLLVISQFGLTLWFSASQLDEREIAKSIESVTANLQRETSLLAAGVREYAWWSDTIDHMIQNIDMEWIRFNFGAQLAVNLGVTEVFALDADHRLLFSGTTSSPDTVDGWRQWEPGQFQGLIEQTQASPMEAPIPFVAFMRKGEQLYMVAACAVTSSESTASEVDRRFPRATLIFSVRLGQGQLIQLQEALSLRDLNWSLETETAAPSLPILNDRGTLLGYLSWNVSLPGSALISRVLLWSTPIMLGCILLGAILFRRFRGVIRRYQEVTVRSAVVRQSQNYFQSMADHAPVLIWQTDLRGRIVYANEAFYELWSQSASADVPNQVADLAIEEERDALLEFFEDICSKGEPREFECKLRGGAEGSRWLAMVGTPQFVEPGKIGGLLFSASDITDRKNAEILAWTRANFDTLTQLPNRNLFQDRLGMELAQAERTGQPLGLMFIDLDNFKNINDSLGHGAGDIVLQQAASRISACLRKPDTVGRLGGDEFVVLMPGVGSRGDYGKVARRIKDGLTSQMTIESVETCLSASIGIAVYPEDGLSGEALMMNADTAMYRAKHNGRNNIVYYDSSMNEELKAAIKMETDLRQAMRNQELFLEYQPIYNSATIEVAGVEALCRWKGKDGTMVPPDQFIPIAERAGLMHELGDQLLVLACQQLRKWLREGRDIYVAVNISPAQFRDRNFPERVKQLMAEYEIEPQRLQLELTERLLLDDSDDIVRMLNNLAECGIKLAVDDFGTGYSALSYLRRFPVHVLKVDRAFVNELPGSTRDQALVKAIITMAHSLGMNVVAEGVETRAQCDFLLANQCELMQGYLYGRPISADQLWEASSQVIPLRNQRA